MSIKATLEEKSLTQFCLVQLKFNKNGKKLDLFEGEYYF